ncbi:MAG: aldo/keto reductase [Bdellovibrionaceae bacterium]|nr:aldo/keto reductase [Pseudobdellovibrionaceae bacterium]|tara:strand:- start:113 stop:958 length:846 start_codon:yes stop_codon:yes gene_type:complete
MSTTLVSNSDLIMPAIVYGTAWKEDRTADLVELALKKGFRGIDTACQPKHYNEPGVGEGIQRAMKNGLSREDLFIQTKFTGVPGQDPSNIPYDPSLPVSEQVKESFQMSLENLGVEFIDSLVLHGPLPDWKDTLAVWKAMEDIAKTNQVGQLGISNCYDPDMLQELLDQSDVIPSVLQNRFVEETGYGVDVRSICRDQGIVFQCFWTLTANPHILSSGPVKDASRDHGVTPAQVFFRFLNQMEIQILTGTTSELHMSQDLAIFEFELNGSQMEQIQALGPF